MSHDMRFPTMWYMRPAKSQTSLRIRAVTLQLSLFLFFPQPGNNCTYYHYLKHVHTPSGYTMLLKFPLLNTPT